MLEMIIEGLVVWIVVAWKNSSCWRSGLGMMNGPRSGDMRIAVPPLLVGLLTVVLRLVMKGMYGLVLMYLNVFVLCQFVS